MNETVDGYENAQVIKPQSDALQLFKVHWVPVADIFEGTLKVRITSI